MDRLQRIQQISGWLRIGVLLLAGLLVVALVLALVTPGQTWVVLGDGQLNELLADGKLSPLLATALTAPLGLLLVLGVYWLQRLFAEYQQGRFFTEGNLRCYLWLVWLKAAGFVYGIAWPLLLSSLAPATAADVGVTIEVGTVAELAVLLVIVHLLREAQRLHDENQAFI